MAIIRGNNPFQVLSPDTKLVAVRVTDIILDSSHIRFKDFGGYDSIGTIFFTELNNSNINTDTIARPLFSTIKNYPLKNEIVLITSSPSKDNKISSYYFPSINIWNHPHHNALPDLNTTPSSKINDYGQDIKRQIPDGYTNINLGEYFQEKLNIKPLLPYEGDTIIEGRFGNSIRFGSTNISDKINTPNGWSNIGELGDPITIIKNGQSDQLDNKGWIHDIEDISNDASSIYMTSNQQLSNFIPASLNQKSFGANLVKIYNFERQLDNIERDIIEVESKEENIDFSDSEVILTDTSPPFLSDSEPSFAENAGALFDVPDADEVQDISGTYQSEEDAEIPDYTGENLYEDLGLSSDSLAVQYELKFNEPIKSRGKSNSALICHVPLSVSKLIDQMTPKTTSSRVQYLVIHTSATPYTDHLNLAATFMISKAWGKGGYHITIDDAGQCVQCYEDSENTNGVGTAGKKPLGWTKAGGNESPWDNGIKNGNTINIAWIGGKHSMNITAPQINAIEELIKFYVSRYPNIKVLGHNQISAKQCPWWDVRAYAKNIGIKTENIFPLQYSDKLTPNVRQKNLIKFASRSAHSIGMDFSKFKTDGVMNDVYVYNLNREPDKRI